MPEWLKKIVESLKAQKIITADNEAVVTAELEKLNLSSEQKIVIDTSKMNDSSVKELVDGLNANLAVLQKQNKDLFDALTKERTDREAAIKTQQDEAKKAQEQKVKDAVDTAIKEGRFAEAKRDYLTKLFNADFDSAAELVKDTAVKKEFQQEQKKTNDAGGENKTEQKSSLLNANKTVMDSILKMANVENN